MIPKLDIEREKRYTKEVKFDKISIIVASVGLLSGILTLILAILCHNISLIVFTSCLIFGNSLMIVAFSTFLITDRKILKLVKDYNKTVIEWMAADFALSVIESLIKNAKKEESKNKTTKKSTRKK